MVILVAKDGLNVIRYDDAVRNMPPRIPSLTVRR